MMVNSYNGQCPYAKGLASLWKSSCHSMSVKCIVMHMFFSSESKMLQDLHMPILQPRNKLVAQVKEGGGIKLYPLRKRKPLNLMGARKGFLHGDQVEEFIPDVKVP